MGMGIILREWEGMRTTVSFMARCFLCSFCW